MQKHEGIALIKTRSILAISDTTRAMAVREQHKNSRAKKTGHTLAVRLPDPGSPSSGRAGNASRRLLGSASDARRLRRSKESISGANDRQMIWSGDCSILIEGARRPLSAICPPSADAPGPVGPNRK